MTSVNPVSRKYLYTKRQMNWKPCSPVDRLLSSLILPALQTIKQKRGKSAFNEKRKEKGYKEGKEVDR